MAYAIKHSESDQTITVKLAVEKSLSVADLENAKGGAVQSIK